MLEAGYTNLVFWTIIIMVSGERFLTAQALSGLSRIDGFMLTDFFAPLILGNR